MQEIPFYFTLTEKERKSSIEALIFASEEVLTKEKLVHLLNTTYEKDGKLYSLEINPIYTITKEELEGIVIEINIDLMENERPYKITEYADGYQFVTINEFGKIVSFYLKSKFKKKLTNAMLETLSIIAYKQPISKPEIEQIRGVNSKEVINNLIERNLIRIIGRSDNIGKALLYGTTNDFLQTFGINHIEELPKLRELEEVANENELEERRDIITLKVSEEDIEKLNAIESVNLENISIDDDLLEDESTIENDDLTLNSKIDVENTNF